LFENPLMDVKSWNSGAFRVKGTDHSVLSFTHYSLLPTPLLCTNTKSMVNHNTHSHFLSLAALRHCTTFTLNDCKQTDSIPDRPAHSSVAIPTELSGPQLICVCTNIEQYDATLAASLYKLRTCLQHNLRPCLLRAGPQKHGYCLIEVRIASLLQSLDYRIGERKIGFLSQAWTDSCAPSVSNIPSNGYRTLFHGVESALGRQKKLLTFPWCQM